MRALPNGTLRLRLLGTVVIAALVSACSSDATRFSGDPFTNPFSSRSSLDPAVTSSVNRAQTTGQARAAGAAASRLANAPTARISSQAIPAPTRPTLAPPVKTAALGAAATGAVASANYPALSPIPPASPMVTGSTTGWSAVGGTPVTLQPGENVATLSQRYGVPASAILAVNGLSGVNGAQPGQQIIIPSYNPASVSGKPAPAMRPVASAPVQALPPRPAAKGESEAEKRAVAKLKPAKPAPKPADDEDEDDDTPPAKVKPKLAGAKPTEVKSADAKAVEAKRAEASKLEAQKKLDLARKEEARKAEAEKKLAAARKEEARRSAGKTKSAANDEPETTASIPETKTAVKTAARPPEPAVEKPADKPAVESEAGPSFRWPAQGRVISGFGARGTGGANDGINIAVPEGTPVRAAEGGTVVHADDALKGYGKLVLIRHASGYVSVYAHNGELNVKRGESVKRGQVIAKSGQTGNVTSPQLHFEIRKGATPVDPTKYLAQN